MRSLPKISVIIPLYNKEMTIMTTLDSVLNQNYPYCETIIVDDGSTDNGPNVVKSFLQYHKDLRYFRIKNSGPSAARNFGVRQSTSDWILFLDADDVLLPNALHSFSSFILHNPSINFYASNYVISDGIVDRLFSTNYKEGVVTNNFRDWFFNRLSPIAGAALFSKSLISNYYFDESLWRYEDAEMLFRMFPNVKVFRINRPTVSYRRDQSEASIPDSSKFNKDFLSRLSFDKAGFWHRACLYQFLLDSYYSYPEQAPLQYAHQKSLPTNRIIYAIAVRLRLIVNR